MGVGVRVRRCAAALRASHGMSVPSIGAASMVLIVRCLTSTTTVGVCGRRAWRHRRLLLHLEGRGQPVLL
jgi:hypothetical protein